MITPEKKERAASSVFTAAAVHGQDYRELNKNGRMEFIDGCQVVSVAWCLSISPLIKITGVAPTQETLKVSKAVLNITLTPMVT